MHCEGHFNFFRMPVLLMEIIETFKTNHIMHLICA